MTANIHIFPTNFGVAQGREKDVILYSSVRSPPGGSLEFISDVRRMNVAFTRARYAFWVVGNSRGLEVCCNCSGGVAPYPCRASGEWIDSVAAVLCCLCRSLRIGSHCWTTQSRGADSFVRATRLRIGFGALLVFQCHFNASASPTDHPD